MNDVTARHHHRPNPWVLFAGIMMAVIGGFGVIEGFTALLLPDYFIDDWYGNVLAVNLVGWGLLHLILGVLILLTGISLLGRQIPTWARSVGIAFVAINMLMQLAWIPAAPVWAIIAIVLDIMVLLALLNPWRHEQRIEG